MNSCFTSVQRKDDNYSEILNKTSNGAMVYKGGNYHKFIKWENDKEPFTVVKTM